MRSFFDNPDDYPPEPTAGDATYAAVKAAASLIPLGEGFLRLVMAPPLETRQNEWWNSVARRLKDLEDWQVGFKIETLKDNPAFVSTMLQATLAAMRTHQSAKLGALRNAVVNAASGSAPSDGLQEWFIALVDALTTHHLLVLELIANKRRGNEKDFRWIRDWKIVEQMAADLESRGLIQAKKRKPTGELVMRGNYRPEVEIKEHATCYFTRNGAGDFWTLAGLTPLGEEFFNFVSRDSGTPGAD